jgi:hypothetical protein
MGWASSGFEIGNKLDARTYPAARTKRTGPVVSPQEDLSGGAASAFTRVWHFRCRVGINGDFNRVVSPAMQGPAIVDELLLEFSASPGATTLPSWMLGYSETLLPQLLDQPVPATFPGSKIIDASYVSDGPQTLPLPGGSMLGFGSQTTGAPKMRLKYIITAPSFYLYFVANAIQNADHSYNGHINVLNNVSQRTLQLVGV